jgi:hypothetical protein
LSHSFFGLGIFKIGSLELFAAASFESQVARISGMSHQHLALVILN